MKMSEDETGGGGHGERQSLPVTEGAALDAE